MGIERSLRTWAHKYGLQKSPLVVAAYRWWSLIRYRNQWEDLVSFRGGEFRIGRDLSLYPAVRNGGFEADEIDAFLPRVSASDVVWDVGGNIGIYSVLLAQAAAKGHVVAFEPVPDSYNRLCGNVAHNSIMNVTAEPLGLSDIAGRARMRVHPDAHGCDHIELGEGEPGSAGSLNISTITGDEYAARSSFGDPDLIKVDIEGHEPEFLRGSWALLSRRKPTLMLEVNPTTWNTPERFQVWEKTLAELFALYGAGLWFDPAGSRSVSEVDVHSLGEHAYTLILPAAP